MGKAIYFSGLNGIRTIAALAVVFSHINNRLHYFGVPNLPLLDIANFGVTIFFTLSGFLITYLLLEEKEKTGTIALKKFYWRRVLRIWPLYFFYLILVILFNDPSTLQWAVLFFVFMVPNFRNSFKETINTVPGSHNLTYMIGHYWSLGVEEQFYLFWPLLVKKLKSILIFACVFPLIFIVLKLILKVTQAPEGWLTFFHYTRFGCLVIGALGAYWVKYQYHSILTFFTKPIVDLSCWLFLLFLSLNQFHIASIIDHEIVALITLGIIFNQVVNPRPLINLEQPWLDFLGKISFGLYVYNPLVIYLVALGLKDFDFGSIYLRYALIYGTTIAVLIAVSFISYQFLEKRFLKLKSKFTVVPSFSSKLQ
jgi:peptidoglycan/LPS O-acetylase OafA/YrhL